eukprot:5465157-Pyramimonas_sp.AAC.1
MMVLARSAWLQQCLGWLRGSYTPVGLNMDIWRPVRVEPYWLVTHLVRRAQHAPHQQRRRRRLRAAGGGACPQGRNRLEEGPLLAEPAHRPYPQRLLRP